MTPGRIRAAMLFIGLGTLIAPLDTAVNVAFPDITGAFGIAVRDIQWVITMFGLAQVGLTISFGKIGDRYGHRTVFMTGLLVSAVALALCASAWSYPSLVVMRVLQGVGAGLVMACGPALVTLVLPAAQRRQALAFYTILMGLGMCLGPLIAGALVQSLGWPAVFWFRVPIALLALIAVWQMRELERHGELLEARRLARLKPLDLSGSLALIVTLGAMVFVIVQVRDPAYGYGLVFAAALAGAISLALLIRQTRLAADPVINLRHFANARFRGLQLAAVLIQMTTFSLFLLMPYQLAAWPGLSLTQAGLVLAVFPGGTVLAGLLGATLTRRLSSGHLVMGGSLLAALGLLGCGWFGAGQALFGVAITMLLTGAGLGVFLVGHLEATLAAMPIGDRGVAGSIVSVTRVLGIAISANLVMWLHDIMRAGASGPQDYGNTFMLAGAALAVWTFGYGLRFSGRETRADRMG